MKMVIASGLSTDGVGGPATYVAALERELPQRHIAVTTVAFDRYLRMPTGVRHTWYLLALMRSAARSNVLLALDAASVGVPAHIVARVFRKHFVIRLGGDFLWEQAVERGAYTGSLRAFYASGHYQTFRPRVFRRIQRALMGAETVIVPNQFFSDIVSSYYHIPEHKLRVVENPIVAHALASQATLSGSPILLYAGRLHKLKNLSALIEAFSRTLPPPWQLRIVGDGPEREKLLTLVEQLGMHGRISFVKTIPKEHMGTEIAQASACVLPSLTDVSPNFVYECLAAGKHSIISAETGITLEHPLLLRFIPDHALALDQALLLLRTDMQDVSKFPQVPERSWDVVVTELLAAIEMSETV